MRDTGPRPRQIVKLAACTTQLYDRRAEEVTLDKVDRILIWTRAASA
jgi:hypothetical protein